MSNQTPFWQVTSKRGVLNMSRLPLAVIACVSYLAISSAAAGERVELRPGNTLDQLTHVTILLEASGHNLVRSQAIEKTEEEQQLPISVSAKIGYDEKRLGLPAEAAPSKPLALRSYQEAEAVIKVN